MSEKQKRRLHKVAAGEYEVADKDGWIVGKVKQDGKHGWIACKRYLNRAAAVQTLFPTEPNPEPDFFAKLRKTADRQPAQPAMSE